MENLNTILGVNLHTASILDINEEKLLLLKSEDYYTKSDLFFLLQNELLKNKDNKDAYSYINYLISYYIMIILTPINYEELAYNYITEALKNSDNVLYKEWCLIFATLERPLLSNINAVSLANDVINEKPQSTIANTILMLF